MSERGRRARRPRMTTSRDRRSTVRDRPSPDGPRLNGGRSNAVADHRDRAARHRRRGRRDRASDPVRARHPRADRVLRRVERSHGPDDRGPPTPAGGRRRRASRRARRRDPGEIDIAAVPELEHALDVAIIESTGAFVSTSAASGSSTRPDCASCCTGGRCSRARSGRWRSSARRARCASSSTSRDRRAALPVLLARGSGRGARAGALPAGDHQRRLTQEGLAPIAHTVTT